MANLTGNLSVVKNATSLVKSKKSIPLEITVFSASAGIVLLVLNSIANGLLFIFVRSEQRQTSRRKTTAKKFILGITIFSLLSVFGLFLDIILVLFEHSPMLLCDILAFTHDHLQFLSYTFCAHFIACISLERYTVIIGSKFQLNRNLHWLFPALIVYVILTWLAIVIENFYYAFIKGQTFCYLPMYEEEFKGSVHSFIVTVVLVTIWQTVCNTITTQCTLRTIRELRRQVKHARSILGDQVSSIETKRLRVTYALGVLFSVIWIPYGITAILHSYIPIQIASSMYIIMRVVVHATFLVLPLIYYKMEKRFEFFVKNKFKLVFNTKISPSDN